MGRAAHYDSRQTSRADAPLRAQTARGSRQASRGRSASPARPADRQTTFPSRRCAAGPSISGSGAASLGWQRRRLPGAGPARRRGGCPECGVRSLPGSAAEGGETEEVSRRSAPCLTCGKCGSWWTRREYGGGRAGGAGARGGSVSSPQPGPLSPPSPLATWPLPLPLLRRPPRTRSVPGRPLPSPPSLPAPSAGPVPSARLLARPGRSAEQRRLPASYPLAFPLWQAAFPAGLLEAFALPASCISPLGALLYLSRSGDCVPL